MAGPVTAGVTGPKFQKRIVVRREMGRWSKDPETAKKLQLNDGQISQLDQIFYEHRLKLIDYGAAMEKEDLKLENLLDADVPNEGQISSQVDQVLSARGKLEREYTMMSLDLRKVLSLDQWRQVDALCDQFETDWQQQRRPRIEDYGGRVEAPVPRACNATTVRGASSVGRSSR